METKPSNSGAVLPGSGACFGAGAGCKKRTPSRLQKHAPASLPLEQAAEAGPSAWGDGRAPIPLLSPLFMSPTTVGEVDQAGARREGGGDQAEGGSGGEQQQRVATRHGGNGKRQAHDAPPKAPPVPGAGWRHPALPTPVAEPASFVPFFQSQCAVEVRNTQQ
ncbi:uncharacterized protein LOC133910980 [Phragmites australis]|uniref:uncharacterized protein LOC133910980 n=1 Tax=Phragmites australis TaxID=29695 RepID=UPI002D7A3346|nr:uncharacterized protein LOC133910980 [Phragmites australis]